MYTQHDRLIQSNALMYSVVIFTLKVLKDLRVLKFEGNRRAELPLIKDKVIIFQKLKFLLP